MNEYPYRVKFEFELSPSQAEELSLLFGHRISQLNEYIMDAMIDEKRAKEMKEDDHLKRLEKEIEYLKARIELLNEIKSIAINSSKNVKN